MFSGSIPALATPFRDGSFDEAAFRKLVDWQIDNGSKALVPCGTTGESATMTAEERQSVISHVVKRANGRVPVVAVYGCVAVYECLSVHGCVSAYRCVAA